MSPHPRQWTPAEDAELRAHYDAGHSWDEIAASLGVSRCSAIARGQRIGCIKHKPDQPRTNMAQSPLVARALEGRRCLEPGDPITWGAIVAGTWLEGTPFP